MVHCYLTLVLINELYLATIFVLVYLFDSCSTCTEELKSFKCHLDQYLHGRAQVSAALQ